MCVAITASSQRRDAMPTRIPETKDLDFKFSLSEDDNKGLFTGYASIWGIIDSYSDIVEKGAFRKSLKERNPLPMLWSHSVDQPIGIISAKEDQGGLRVEGHLNLDVQKAQEIRSLMKQGAVRGLSIGYETIKSEPGEIDKTQVRRLQEIRLWEISPVVFPACREALISDVKSERPGGEPDATSTPEPETKPDVIHLEKDKLEVIQLLEAWRLLIESSRQTI